MITKEISVFYKGNYYQNMKEFALVFIPENWLRDEEDWYIKIKAFLMKNYQKYKDIRIIDDNKFDNFLNGINNSKKNFIKIELDKDKIVSECPFNWRKRMDQEKEQRKIEKEQKLEKKEIIKDIKYYKEPSIRKINRDCENHFCKLYKLSDKDMNKLSNLTDIGMSILISLKYRVYPPSEKLEKLISKGIEIIEKNKGS